MENRMIYSLVLLVLAVPLLYLAAVWGHLPPKVPMHYNMYGQPDRWGEKYELIIAAALLSGLGFGAFLLMINIHKIDPKKAGAYGKRTMLRIGVASAVLISSINFLIIQAATSSKLFSVKNLFAVLGLFFAFMGNEMCRLKPNYFVGLRTPWALHNDENWRKTHMIGGKLWYAGGIIIFIGSILLPATAAFVLFIVIVLLLLVIPFIYSYKLFKGRQH